MGRFKEHREAIEYLALVSQVGLTMAGSIGLGFATGYYLDRWLRTRGILLVVFLLLGVVGGAATVYRQIMSLNKDKSQSGEIAPEDKR